MEGQQGLWRSRLTFRNATIVLCSLNLAAALILLLHAFLALPARSAAGAAAGAGAAAHLDPAQLRYILESEEIRRAMEPKELIKRIQEIKQEVYSEPEIEKQNFPKQTAAVDLSKRLKDIRATNDVNSQKALEEWRKRKMDRARQREFEKNGTVTAQV